MRAAPVQTLYVTVRRDELRRLQQERDQLQQQVDSLSLMLANARGSDKTDLRR